MKQGYSGSTLRLIGDRVEKVSSDEVFAHSKERQAHLIALSRQTAVLPRIYQIKDQVILMEYVPGEEGLSRQSARAAGKALRELHGLGADYPFPCLTGLGWLIELANENLAQMGSSQRIGPEIMQEYPTDALIHSEPGQYIEMQDGSIVFIDIEGIGLGTRYHDLGSIYYGAIVDGQPDTYDSFIEGYHEGADPIDLSRVKQLAGIYSFAYACFADFEKRMELGFRLYSDITQHGSRGA